jgi:hypothetical protein
VSVLTCVVLKIITFSKSGNFQALVQMSDLHTGSSRHLCSQLGCDAFGCSFFGLHITEVSLVAHAQLA